MFNKKKHLSIREPPTKIFKTLKVHVICKPTCKNLGLLKDIYNDFQLKFQI